MMRIQTKRWNPSRFAEIGRGGEAVIYRLREDMVAKVFLPPDACEFANEPELQEAAKVRIAEMQTKLFEFPQDLPGELVVPNAVMIDKEKKVFGYAMPYIEGTVLGQLSRTSSVLSAKSIGVLLVKLHDLVCSLHVAKVVLGDFNENNIIVAGGVPHLIDADSMQFGPYQCRSFIPKFTAPELLRAEKPKKKKKKKKKTSSEEADESSGLALAPRYTLAAPHNEMTDWYSFLVIAMRLITRTDPYGGVVPKMPIEERLREGVTVFDSRCVYPRVARPLKSIARPVLEAFFRTFHRGERFIPDKSLFTVPTLWA